MNTSACGATPPRVARRGEHDRAAVGLGRGRPVDRRAAAVVLHVEERQHHAAPIVAAAAAAAAAVGAVVTAADAAAVGAVAAAAAAAAAAPSFSTSQRGKRRAVHRRAHRSASRSHPAKSAGCAARCSGARRPRARRRARPARASAAVPRFVPASVGHDRPRATTAVGPFRAGAPRGRRGARARGRRARPPCRATARTRPTAAAASSGGGSARGSARLGDARPTRPRAGGTPLMTVCAGIVAIKPPGATPRAPANTPRPCAPPCAMRRCSRPVAPSRCSHVTRAPRADRPRSPTRPPRPRASPTTHATRRRRARVVSRRQTCADDERARGALVGTVQAKHGEEPRAKLGHVDGVAKRREQSKTSARVTSTLPRSSCSLIAARSGPAGAAPATIVAKGVSGLASSNCSFSKIAAPICAARSPIYATHDGRRLRRCRACAARFGAARRAAARPSRRRGRWR